MDLVSRPDLLTRLDMLTTDPGAILDISHWGATSLVTGRCLHIAREQSKR